MLFYHFDLSQAERFFTDSLDEWREKMGIEKMTLIGHSLGGYIVSAYALKYPVSHKVQHKLREDSVRRDVLMLESNSLAGTGRQVGPVIACRDRQPSGKGRRHRPRRRGHGQ